MKERKFSLGVFVCIFNKDISKILLIKRNKQKVSTYLGEWGNVGGKIEPGEYSIDAAIREASEEISVNLEKKNLKQIAIVENPDNPIFKNWHVRYLKFIHCIIQFLQSMMQTGFYPFIRKVKMFIKQFFIDYYILFIHQQKSAGVPDLISDFFFW